MKFSFMLLFDWTDIPILHKMSVHTTKVSNTPGVLLLPTEMFFFPAESIPLSITQPEPQIQGINMDFREKEINRRTTLK